MKISSVVLAVSLAANAALVAVFVAGGSAKPATPATSSIPAAAAPAKPGDTSDTNVWSVVHHEDLRTEVERLKAEGFPPSVLRAIIAAQVRESFAARRKALEGADSDKFWLAPNRDPNVQAELRALAREEAKLLKDLLGPNPENYYAASLRRQVPELPDDKVETLAQIQERYAEQRSELFANVRGTLLPDERDKMQALEKAMRAEFAAVLSPQEYEAYNLRMSNTANQMRYELSAFDPNEQEFRAIFKLKHAFDEQWGGLSIATMNSEESRRSRSEAQKLLDEGIRGALGAQRYLDYQRATDYNYRTTSQLVARLELPPDATNQVYALQQDLQQRATAIRTDRSTTLDTDRNARMAALAAEAQMRITAVLGSRGYEAYKQYGGQWLQILQPPRAASDAPGVPGVIRSVIQVTPGR